MAEFINTVDVIGDDAVTDSILNRSIVEYKDNIITSIGQYAFASCSALTTVDFPAVTSIGNYAFNKCSTLTTADFPAVTSIGNYAFNNCSALTTVNFPVATSIGSNAFYSCSTLTTADFPAVTSIGNYVFGNSYYFKTLILRNTEKVSALSSTNAFHNTSIKVGAGYIYVPAALVDSYKAATNWSTFANQIRAIEDYPEITGG